MPKSKATSSSDSSKKRRPALSPEARENQMIALAVNLAEQQLRDGTASSQVITHFLKRGSMKEKLEQEILKEQKDLIKAKTEAIKSAEKIEKLYEEAMIAMKTYSGNGGFEDAPKD